MSFGALGWDRFDLHHLEKFLEEVGIPWQSIPIAPPNRGSRRAQRHAKRHPSSTPLPSMNPSRPSKKDIVDFLNKTGMAPPLRLASVRYHIACPRPTALDCRSRAPAMPAIHKVPSSLPPSPPQSQVMHMCAIPDGSLFVISDRVICNLITSDVSVPKIQKFRSLDALDTLLDIQDVEVSSWACLIAPIAPAEVGSAPPRPAPHHGHYNDPFGSDNGRPETKSSTAIAGITDIEGAADRLDRMGPAERRSVASLVLCLRGSTDIVRVPLESRTAQMTRLRFPAGKRLLDPVLIATDPTCHERLYVVDMLDSDDVHRVDKVTTATSRASLVEIMLDEATHGEVVRFTRIDMPSFVAEMCTPGGLVVNHMFGVVYLSNRLDSTILRYSPTEATWSVLGEESPRDVGGGPSSGDGSIGFVSLSQPMGLTSDRMGRVFVADHGSGAIRVINPITHTLSTVMYTPDRRIDCDYVVEVLCPSSPDGQTIVYALSADSVMTRAVPWSERVELAVLLDHAANTAYCAARDANEADGADEADDGDEKDRDGDGSDGGNDADDRDEPRRDLSAAPASIQAIHADVVRALYGDLPMPRDLRRAEAKRIRARQARHARWMRFQEGRAISVVDGGGDAMSDGESDDGDDGQHDGVESDDGQEDDGDGDGDSDGNGETKVDEGAPDSGQIALDYAYETECRRRQLHDMEYAHLAVASRLSVMAFNASEVEADIRSGAAHAPLAAIVSSDGSVGLTNFRYASGGRCNSLQSPPGLGAGVSDVESMHIVDAHHTFIDSRHA